MCSIQQAYSAQCLENINRMLGQKKQKSEIMQSSEYQKYNPQVNTTKCSSSDCSITSFTQYLKARRVIYFVYNNLNNLTP